MIELPRRQECELTGRARARHGWFGRLVLQVEERVEEFSECPPPPGRKNDAAWRDFCRKGVSRRWRDSTWEDLQERPEFVLGRGAVHVPPQT